MTYQEQYQSSLNEINAAMQKCLKEKPPCTETVQGKKEGKKMLLKDVNNCDDCPLRKNELCGGFGCYGGEPVEPACCSLEDDTDLDEWVKDYFERQKRRDQHEQILIQKEQKRRERALKAAQTRQEMKWFCRKELDALKQAQKAFKIHQAIEEQTRVRANAINFANKVFNYEDRVEVNPEITKTTKKLQKAVEQAKEKYDEKRKEFYEKRKHCTKKGNGGKIK